MFPYTTSALYVEEAEKTPCLSQPNSVFKKHFLLLEGRRLGFRQGMRTGRIGRVAARGAPSPLPWRQGAAPQAGVCEETCGPKPPHNEVRVPGTWTCFCSRAGEWATGRKGEEPDKRHHAVKTRAHEYIRDQISQIKPD